VAAVDGFRLVAAMNPFDAIGTARISGAVYDRVCRLSVSYQSAPEEAAIVSRSIGGGVGPSPDWIDKAVTVVRRTRSHPELRVGSSVRGAIDASAVAVSLAQLRDVPADDQHVGLDAAIVALSGRVRVREGVSRTSEEIVAELWREVFGFPEADGGDGSGKGGAPIGATNSH
jgi:MoxR-like ATPase